MKPRAWIALLVAATIVAGGEPPRPGLEFVAIEGCIVVVDDAGNERATENGEIDFGLSTVPVREGRWQTDVGRRWNSLYFDRITLGGRRVVTDEEGFQLPVQVPLLLRAHYLRPSSLRVMSDDEGADLTDVEIVTNAELRWGDSRSYPPPGRVRTVAEHARSLFEIPEVWDDRSERYWARAPGYAWAGIDIHHRIGGERRLRLLRGGAIDLTLVNVVRESGTVLRIRAVGEHAEAPVVEIETDEDVPRKLDSLPGGDYRVTAEIGHWKERPVVLATSEARVIAGRTTAVTLALTDPPPPAPTASIRGTLAMSTAWGVEVPVVRVEWPPQLEGASPPRHCNHHIDAGVEAAGPGEWRWFAAEVPIGLCAVVVSPSNHAVLAAVAPMDERSVRVEVPDPAAVIVRTIDVATGDPAPDSYLCWAPERPPELSNASCGSEPPGAEPGVYRFFAPMGTIRVWVDSSPYRQPDTPGFAIRNGTNEYVVHVRQECGVLVKLRDGVAQFPTLYVHASVEPIGHDGEACCWGGRQDGSVVRVTDPGRYRVTIAPIDGYEPIPPREVEVPDGGFAEVEIALVRKP